MPCVPQPAACRLTRTDLAVPRSYIPSDLAYGDRGRPPKIGGGDCLVFTIEILKITGGKKPKA